MFTHNFDPVFIDFGLFQIKWYSLAYILGIVIGWFYAIKIIKKTENNEYHFKQIKKADFDDLVFYLLFGVIIGGRLGYVIFYNIEYYSQNFLEIFKLWQGGMSFHGGLIGVIFSIFFYSKKKGENFFKYSDIVSCVAPIGIFFGRIANFINGELYGKVSSLPWAIIFPNADSSPRHPSQIYEAALEGLVLFLIINYLALKKKLLFKPAYISAIFLILYSIFRIFSENFREADKHLGYFFEYFSLGIILSLVTLLAGFFIILLMKKK